jgi:hypothetical protein
MAITRRQQSTMRLLVRHKHSFAIARRLQSIGRHLEPAYESFILLVILYGALQLVYIDSTLSGHSVARQNGIYLSADERRSLT